MIDIKSGHLAQCLFDSSKQAVLHMKSCNDDGYDVLIMQPSEVDTMVNGQEIYDGSYTSLHFADVQDLEYMINILQNIKKFWKTT